ncbi:MAG: hypothetical protein WD357_04580 [Gracilimonas sp.]
MKQEKIDKLFDELPVVMRNASKSFKPNKSLIVKENQELVIETTGDEFDQINLKGNIYLNLWPKPRFLFKIETSNSLFQKYHLEGKPLTIKKDNLSYKCHITKITNDNFGPNQITFKNSSNIVQHPKVKEISYATFYLLNFPFCLGQAIRNSQKKRSSYKGRILINDGEWNITLDKLEGYKSLQNEMSESDGYLITYSGKIEKTNNKSFTSDELLVRLNKFYWLLSFVRGALTAPVLIDGFDKNKKVIWQDRSLRSVGRWSLTQRNNWFSPQHVNEIFELLSPGWSELFEHELWKNEIHKILYWYTYAGRGVAGAGTDGSVILAMSALELLAFNYLVQEKGLRTKEKFERKSLSNNIFKVLEDLEIPFNLPEELKEFKAYSKNKSWQTGPKAISELRNEIVHPARESSPSSTVCFEAQQLSLWYVEMIILRMCGYDGIYSNRLKRMGWVGDVESVPWKKMK